MSGFSDILNTQEPFSMRNLWTALRGTQTPSYKVVSRRGNAWAAQATAIAEEAARQQALEEAAHLRAQEAARVQAMEEAARVREMEEEAARVRAMEEEAARVREMEEERSRLRESRHSEKLSKAIKEKARSAAQRLYRPYRIGDYIVIRQGYTGYNWYTAGQIVGISGRVFDIQSPDGYKVSVLDENIIGPITSLNARQFTRFKKYTGGGSRRKRKASKLKRTRKQ